MSSVGTGRNTPPSSSGSPGSSQAMTRIAGSTVILANPVPPATEPRAGAGAGGGESPPAQASARPAAQPRLARPAGRRTRNRFFARPAGGSGWPSGPRWPPGANPSSSCPILAPGCPARGSAPPSGWTVGVVTRGISAVGAWSAGGTAFAGSPASISSSLPLTSVPPADWSVAAVLPVGRSPERTRPTLERTAGRTAPDCSAARGVTAGKAPKGSLTSTFANYIRNHTFITRNMGRKP